MEFFETSGDTAVGFQPREEIFDAMAFVIEVHVKGGFAGTIGFRGYDGDAAESAHISADGVAVVSLVHDGAGARAQVGLEQRLGLIEVGHVGAGENKPEGITERVTGQMNFGGETGAGAGHRLGGLTAGRIGPVSMHAHGGAIDHAVFVVAVPRAQTGQHRRPQAVFGPRAKPVVDALPWPEGGRQVAPRRASAQYPQDGLDPEPQVPTAPATAMCPSQAVPMGLNFLSSSQSLSARTNLGCWFTTR